MSGFLPVAHDALNAVEPDAYGAVVDLYKRAHSLRWRQFEATERSLSSRWGLGNRRVWSVLETLEELGLLELQRGSKGTPTKIRVFDPTATEQAAVSDTAQQVRQQERQQNGPASTPVMAERAAEVSAEGAEILTKLETETRSVPPAEEPRESASTIPSGPVSLQAVADLVAVQVTEAEAHRTGPLPDDPMDQAVAPEWARRAKRPAGVSPLEFAAGVVGVLNVITGRLRSPDACKTDAAAVLTLWTGLGRPPWEPFLADLELVAEAAHTCPDPIFARDIRAEGWADGKPRDTSAAAVCRQNPPPRSSGATWDERLEVARQWDRAGRPLGGSPNARDAPAKPTSGFQALLDMRRELDGSGREREDEWLQIEASSTFSSR